MKLTILLTSPPVDIHVLCLIQETNIHFQCHLKEPVHLFLGLSFAIWFLKQQGSGEVRSTVRPQSLPTESLISLLMKTLQRFKPDSGQVMRCFRWHISIYTNKIKLHRHVIVRKKGSTFLRTLMAVSLEDFATAARNHSDAFTSGVLTANQITSLVG